MPRTAQKTDRAANGGMGGELHYEGFVVFIYKTALEDTVRTVQKR